MEINVGKYAGFCFGVERAVNTVTELLKNSEKTTHIYTLGKLIHNPTFIKKLSGLPFEIYDTKRNKRVFSDGKNIVK